MKLSEKEILLLEYIKENLFLIEKSKLRLEQSFHNCVKFSVNDNLGDEEYENFEILTSRFARTSDILTQKIFKTFFKINGEEVTTFIDKANFIEKIGLVEDAGQLISIRNLRNNITHDYEIENIINNFKQILISTPILIELIKKTKSYFNEKLFDGKLFE